MTSQHNLPPSELKHLLKLAMPAALTMAANMLMQIVDTMFVGRLGAAALGGVSVGNAYFSTLMIIGVGFLFGLDFLVSHAFGAGRIRDCHRYLIQALYFVTGLSIVFTAVMWFTPGVFDFFGVKSDVAEQASLYLRPLALNLWPLLAGMAVNKYLQAQGIGMPILWFFVFANIVNAVANWLLVFGNWGFPAMGIAGSGWATLIARVCLLVVAVVYMLRRDRKQKLGLSEVALGFDGKTAYEIFKLGLPAAAQLLLEVGVFATATMLAGRLGSVPVASHQVVLLIASFTFMVPLGLSTAAAVRVGQALGAGYPVRAVRTGWFAIATGAVFMLFAGLTMFIFSKPLLSAFTHDEAVINAGASLLLVAAFFQLSDGVQVVATGVLRGVGNTRASMYANLIGHWVLGLPIGYLLCFHVGWGTQGLWIGLSIGLTAVAAALLSVWSKKSNLVATSGRTAARDA